MINGTSNTVVRSGRVGAFPDALLYNSITGKLYVANCGDDNVSVVSGTTLLQSSSIPVGRCPSAIALSAVLDELLVANFYSKTGGYSNVTLVNATTGIPSGSIQAAFGARALCIDPSNGYLYVANAGSSNLTVINLSARAQVPPGIAVDAWPQQSYPTTITYDPIEQDLIVPTVYASALYVVGDVPSVVSTLVTPRVDEVNRSLTIRSTVVGGTAPLAFGYGGLPPGCTTYDTSSLSCIPSRPGTYSITVDVTDAHGFQSLAEANVSVRPQLSLSNLTLTPNVLDVGESEVISETASGGVGDYTYSYGGLPGGCAGSNSSRLACLPSSPGLFQVRATVRDALNAQAVTYGSLMVYGPLSVTLILPSGPNVTVGQVFDLIASVSGGAGAYNYSYYGLPPGCSTADASVLACDPVSSGTWQPSVIVTDAGGVVARGSAALTVRPTQSPIPKIEGFWISPANITLGTATTLIVLLTGTFGNWSLSFVSMPPGCPSQMPRPSGACRPARAPTSWRYN
jgi:YVTN family beta-propeller protein